MRKLKILLFLIICLIVFLFVALFRRPEIPNDVDFGDIITNVEDKKAVKIKTVDEGYDIYPLPSGSGYRYGPSIMYYDDGSVDIWFAREGNNSTEWDYICYRHSDDGINWTPEEIVLRPTPGTLDHYSVCDPAVIYFNGWYYMGYTSAASPVDGGINNSCYVARSMYPNGPFEKWNGNGWGGEPDPFIEFEGDSDEWGLGELSFVKKDDTLFVYYSSNSINGNFTEIATTDTGDNWPAHIVFQNVYGHENGEDSMDVAYVEETDSFIAVSVVFRFTESSGITIYNSKDGINFKVEDTTDRNIHPYAHNIGLSKNPEGHIDRSENLYISYAYGYDNYSKWGRWATRFQEVKLLIE